MSIKLKNYTKFPKSFLTNQKESSNSSYAIGLFTRLLLNLIKNFVYTYLNHNLYINGLLCKKDHQPLENQYGRCVS